MALLIGVFIVAGFRPFEPFGHGGAAHEDLEDLGAVGSAFVAGVAIDVSHGVG